MFYYKCLVAVLTRKVFKVNLFCLIMGENVGLRNEKVVRRSFRVDAAYILIALVVFNVLLVVHFLIAIAGILLGFFAGAFGLIIGGIAGFLVSLIYPFVAGAWLAEYISFGGVHPVAGMILSVSIICFGGLWMIVNFYLSKYFIRGLRWYWKLNVRVFKKYEF